MNKRSPLIHRLVLVLSALVALGAAAWAGLRAFEPVPIPPVPASKPSVTFDPRADIRTNPLFATLQAVVRGEIQIGALGRTNPFAAPGTGSSSVPSSDASATRGSVQEIPLEGAQAFAFAPATNGGILALVGGSTASGVPSYEIRFITPDATPTVVGRWNAPGGTTEGHPLTPVALRQSSEGRIWLLSLGGFVGSLQSDGSVSWSNQSLLPPFATSGIPGLDGFVIDDIGRLWVITDGAQVFVGNGTGFQAIDLAAQLSDQDRVALAARASTEGAPADHAWRLQTLSDGRIAVIAPGFGAVFMLSLQGKAQVTRVPDGAQAVAFGPDGSLWSLGPDGGLLRQTGSVTQAYTDVRVLPKQAMVNALLAASSRESLYALDYAPTGTVLWHAQGDDWVAQVIPPQGAQPQDQVERVTVDGQGMVWALLRQRGLLLIRPPKTP